MGANCRGRSVAVAEPSRISRSSSISAPMSLRSRSSRVMCVWVSSGVNISLTRETNRASSLLNWG